MVEVGGCSPRKGRNDDYDCDSEPTGWVDLLNHQGVCCPRFLGKETETQLHSALPPRLGVDGDPCLSDSEQPFFFSFFFFLMN